MTMQHSSFSPAQLIQTLSSADQENFEKLKAAYDACMNEDKIKKDGLKPLMEILKDITDMFPVKGSVYERDSLLESADKEDLADAIGYLAKLGVPAFISAGAGADDKDPDTVVVQVRGIPHRLWHIHKCLPT
jgi:endothelin-converting enzyme